MTPEEQQRQQQYHDVNRPGRTGPSPTSRPVIVGHRPTMPDPMLTNRPTHHPQTQPGEPITSRPTVRIPIDGISSRPVQPSVQNEPSVMEGEPLQSPPFDSNIYPHHPPKEHHPQTHAESDPLFHGSHEAGEHSALSREGIKKERSKWWAPFVVLLIILIALYLLIDSGLIHTSIQMPIHLFPQETPPIYTPYFK